MPLNKAQNVLLKHMLTLKYDADQCPVVPTKVEILRRKMVICEIDPLEKIS